MTGRTSDGNAGPLFRTAFRALLKKVPDFFAKVLLQLFDFERCRFDPVIPFDGETR
jgi:hypothetical protein